MNSAALLTATLSLAAAATASAPLIAQAGAPARAATPAAGYADAVMRARAIIRDSMAAGRVPGLSVAVAVDGRVVWSEGFGLADVESGVPVTPSTRIRIGSVSKPLAAVAVALLVERERLDLDLPVQRYVPSFPEKRYPVTTRQLAGHLAGIRHYKGDEFMSMRAYPTVTDGLGMFRDDTLVFRPGTRFSYSSHGFNLLSAVVEGAAGEDFLPYMRTKIFAPLGMRMTIAEHADSLIEHRARYYVRAANGTVLNAPYVDNSYKWAGGGFLSTTEDLVRFGSALLQPGFLKAETLRLLFTSQRTSDGKETGYAIGWSEGSDSAGRRTLSHGGSSVGANAHLILYPAERVVVAILANTSSQFVGSGRGAQQIARLFFR
ncbi:MAG: beta-lactamase family protein [Gemmatimonadota bacterium]|nr:beta-lactamase family protein [Gemmatimonadota bacterium]